MRMMDEMMMGRAMMADVKTATPGNSDKYNGKAIRWSDKGDHYELIFTDDFVTPSSGASGMSVPGGYSLLTDIVADMKDADKKKEVHVFIGSYGGSVTALSMVLQQLLQFEYRVGIDLGAASSCGWMLLFACQERYVSPYSSALYHEMSAFCFGKHTELRNHDAFMERWQKELNKVTDTASVLTEKEMELGRTSEVWLTGQELIERKAAKDYSEYATRKTPLPVSQVIEVNGELYRRTAEGWLHLKADEENKKRTYAELVQLCQTEGEPKENSAKGNSFKNEKKTEGK